MRIVRLVVAGCVAALLSACGATAATQLSAVQSSTAPAVGRQLGAQPHAAGMLAAFGEQHTWGNGLMITIAPPRSIKPSDTAYPQADRAAVFEMTVDNNTPAAYKPSQLAIRAMLGATPTKEVVDPAQGLNGFGAAAQDIPPGKSAKVTLAFAMPHEAAELRIVVQPDVSGGAPPATFQGTA